MIETDNLKLEKYELTDAANLTDGYNNSMDKLDAYATTINGKFPITSADIEAGGINTDNIANGAITTNKIATAAITEDKLATDAVSTDSIGDGQVTADKLAPNAVSANVIVDNSITSEKINPGSIGNAQLANDSVTADKVVDGEILNRHIGDAQLTIDKFVKPMQNTFIIEVAGVLRAGTSLQGNTETEWEFTVPYNEISNILNSAGADSFIVEGSNKLQPVNGYVDYEIFSYNGITIIATIHMLRTLIDVDGLHVRFYLRTIGSGTIEFNDTFSYLFRLIFCPLVNKQSLYRNRPEVYASKVTEA